MVFQIDTGHGCRSIWVHRNCCVRLMTISPYLTMDVDGYIHETATFRPSQSLQISINWSKSCHNSFYDIHYVYHIGHGCENMMQSRLILVVVSPWSYRLPEIFCHRRQGGYAAKLKALGTCHFHGSTCPRTTHSVSGTNSVSLRHCR